MQAVAEQKHTVDQRSKELDEREKTIDAAAKALAERQAKAAEVEKKNKEKEAALVSLCTSLMLIQCMCRLRRHLRSLHRSRCLFIQVQRKAKPTRAKTAKLMEKVLLYLCFRVSTCF